MREQLQVHIQTIGILVAEKSELESKLTHSDHALKRKAGQLMKWDGFIFIFLERLKVISGEMLENIMELAALFIIEENTVK